MEVRTAILGSRGVVRVAGPEARAWLQGLVTSDVETLGPGEARFAALLTPQGKILFDFLVVPDGDGLLLDCAADQASALAKRLGFYKLRAAVQVADLSASLSVAALWSGAPPALAQGRIIADPRVSELGWRVIAPPSELNSLEPSDGEADYDAHRIACGAPQGGRDFAWGDTFPHEANMDRLNGVDFRKGCYVGQEVVSRVEHRGLARKRIMRVSLEGVAPEGEVVRAGEVAVGVMGSSAGGMGLALLRLDKVDEATAPLMAGSARLLVRG